MDALEFFNKLYEFCPVGGSIELRRLANTDAQCLDRRFTLDRPQRERFVNLWITQQEEGGDETGVFFGVAMRRATSSRGTKRDIYAIPALWADIDVGKMGWDLKRTIAAIKMHPALRPSVLVRSGSGLHAYWCLEQPIILSGDPEADATRIAVVEQTMKRLAELFGGDRTHDITRVLRVPGSYNTKDGKLRRVEVEYADWTVYAFEELAEAAILCDTALEDGSWLSKDTIKARAKAKRAANKLAGLANDFMADADLPEGPQDYELLWRQTVYMGGGRKVRGTAWIGLDEAILRATAILYARHGGEWTDEMIVKEVLFRVKEVKQRDAPRETWDWTKEAAEIADKLERFKPRWDQKREQRRLLNNGKTRGKGKRERGTDGAPVAGSGQRRRKTEGTPETPA